MATHVHTHSPASPSERLLEPVWAQVMDITNEAEGISTYWLKFTTAL